MCGARARVCVCVCVPRTSPQAALICYPDTDSDDSDDSDDQGAPPAQTLQLGTDDDLYVTVTLTEFSFMSLACT